LPETGVLNKLTFNNLSINWAIKKTPSVLSISYLWLDFIALNRSGGSLEHLLLASIYPLLPSLCVTVTHKACETFSHREQSTSEMLAHTR
jgi:hypothetical protein